MNRIEIYKFNGIETPPIDRPTIYLESHSLYSSRVIITVEGRRYEVEANDLLEAIKRVEGA